MVHARIAGIAINSAAADRRICSLVDGNSIKAAKSSGPARACALIEPQVMGIRRLEDLECYQLTRAFKLEVYRLLRLSDGVRLDGKYRSQLSEALAGAESNIAEGFRRWIATEISRFLMYAIASLEEALRRLGDGIDRGYFREADCEHALHWALGQSRPRRDSGSPSSRSCRRSRRAAAGRRARAAASRDRLEGPDRRTGP
jgi:four helix bundle protein